MSFLQLHGEAEEFRFVGLVSCTQRKNISADSLFVELLSSGGICGWYPSTNGFSIFVYLRGKLLSDSIIPVTTFQVLRTKPVTSQRFTINSVIEPEAITRDSDCSTRTNYL